MGTSYKALLRAFVITSAFRGFTCFLKVCLLLPRDELSGNRLALLYILPPVVVSLVGNLATVAFIGFGLIGGYVHSCRDFSFFSAEGFYQVPWSPEGLLSCPFTPH